MGLKLFSRRFEVRSVSDDSSRVLLRLLRQHWNLAGRDALSVYTGKTTFTNFGNATINSGLNYLLQIAQWFN